MKTVLFKSSWGLFSAKEIHNILDDWHRRYKILQSGHNDLNKKEGEAEDFEKERLDAIQLTKSFAHNGSWQPTERVWHVQWSNERRVCVLDKE